MSLPDFLVIGAQKAGTTWVYANLQSHPQIWLPPIKEIHYFDRSNKPLIWDAFRGIKQRDMLWRWLRPALQDIHKNPQNRGWHWHYFVKPRSHQWYEQCFHPNESQLAGDITPAYARLSKRQVEKVYQLLPNARIIYLLRNPVERMWSQAAMYFSRYGHHGLVNANDKEIQEFLSWDLARANNNYLETISCWRSYYPQEQFHLDFFDRLAENPYDLYTDLCRFLKIDSNILFSGTITQKVHSRQYPPIPQKIARQLYHDYHPLLENISKNFPNKYTNKWLDNVHKWDNLM